MRTIWGGLDWLVVCVSRAVCLYTALRFMDRLIPGGHDGVWMVSMSCSQAVVTTSLEALSVWLGWRRLPDGATLSRGRRLRLAAGFGALIAAVGALSKLIVGRPTWGEVAFYALAVPLTLLLGLALGVLPYGRLDGPEIAGGPKDGPSPATAGAVGMWDRDVDGT